MEEVIPVIPSAGVLIIHEEKVLLVHATSHQDNVWGLPAGRIEEGETAIIAALRELEEETCLFAKEGDLEPLPTKYSATIIKKDGQKRIYPYDVFICRRWQGEIKSTEQSTPKWVDLSQIDEIELLPNVGEIIREGLGIISKNIENQTVLRERQKS